jgi:hypothetical protein
VIRVDAVWLAVEPVDLRLGPDSALAHREPLFSIDQRALPIEALRGCPPVTRREAAQ